MFGAPFWPWPFGLKGRAKRTLRGGFAARAHGLLGLGLHRGRAGRARLDPPPQVRSAESQSSTDTHSTQFCLQSFTETSAPTW